MKKYRYLIAYVYGKTNGMEYGSSVILRDEKIKDADDLHSIEDLIKEHNGYSHKPAIMNYILMEIVEQ